MTTDSERREVARRLRETAEEIEPRAFNSGDLLHLIEISAGTRTYSGKEVFYLLADLIEPAPPHCIAEVKISGDELEGCVNRAIAEYTGIDRGALLELADYMEEKAQFARASTEHAVIYAGYAREYESFARRIREACGEGER